MPFKLNRTQAVIQNPRPGESIEDIQKKKRELDVTTGAPMSLRALLSLAETPQGMFNILEHRFGKGNVEYIGGRLSYRPTPTSPNFIAVDEDNFTVRDLIDILGEAPEAIGATAGAIAFPGLGGIPGAAAGGVFGYGIKSGLREKYAPGAEPTSPAQETKRAAFAGLTEGAGQGAGHLITTTAGKIAKGFSSTLVPEEQAASRVLGSQGSFLTPAQATTSRTLDILENVAEKSFFGGGRVTAFKQSQYEAIDQAIDRFAGDFGAALDPEDLGQIVLDTLDDRINTFQRVTQRLYKRVDVLNQGAGVATDGLKKEATLILDRLMKGSKTVRNNRAVSLAQEVLDLPDHIPFEDAIILRSDWLKASRHPSLMQEMSSDQYINAAERLASKTDRAMATASAGVSPEAYNTWRRANRVFAIGKDRFNNKLITQLARQGRLEPEIIGKKIFRQGHPALIKNIKEIFKPNEFMQVQSGFVEEMLRDATDKATDKLSGTKLLSFVNPESRGSYGKSFLNTMFTPEQLKNITDIAKTLRLVQAKQAEGAGGMAIQLTQMGALGLILGGSTQAAKRTAATILLGPVVAAKIITNPKWSRRFVHGIQLSARGGNFLDQGTKLLTRLFAEVSREGIVEPMLEPTVGGSPQIGTFPTVPIREPGQVLENVR